MPSKHQPGAKYGDYDSDEKQMLATKNDLTIAALIRGIRKPERARQYVQAEVELADEQDRDVRTEVIGALNRKISALEDDDTDDTPVDVDTGDGSDEDDDADTGDDGAHDGDDSDDTPDDPYPDVPRFEDDDALRSAIDDHDHKDTFTVAKPAGTLAGCFECESHIGLVPRDGGGE